LVASKEWEWKERLEASTESEKKKKKEFHDWGEEYERWRDSRQLPPPTEDGCKEDVKS